jgi:predicted phage terminase large subunit-like protein
MLTAGVVEGFCGSLLAPGFDQATKSPDFHKEMWQMYCSSFPRVAVAAPRGHAKSTAGTVAYGLACLLFRESRFLVIVSDTEAQAVMFLKAMVQELQNNEQLIKVFGVVPQFLKDTESDIIIAFEDGHTIRVMAKGAEQKLRGLNWNGTRPDLIIVDDLENDELVMNKDRREKLMRWFFGALMPALSPSGKIRVHGTVVHQDSLLNSLMPQDSSRIRKEQDLKTWDDWPDGRPRGWLSVKYKAHNKDLTKFLWPERFGKDYFQDKRADYLSRGLSDLYSQEYLNEPIDESVAYFKKSDFLTIKEEDWKTRKRRYLSFDPAVSESERADYSVFVLAGVDEDRVLHIENVVRERLDGKDIVDYILAMHRHYDLEAIGLPKDLITKTLGSFLREEMIRQNSFPTIVELPTTGKNKVQCARSIQARMRAKTVKFAKEADWYPQLEDEMTKFPRGTKDDVVDAMSYMGMLLDKIVEAPTEQEAEDEEQDELRREYRSQFSGRSHISGY